MDRNLANGIVMALHEWGFMSSNSVGPAIDALVAEYYIGENITMRSVGPVNTGLKVGDRVKWFNELQQQFETGTIAHVYATGAFVRMDDINSMDRVIPLLQLSRTERDQVLIEREKQISEMLHWFELIGSKLDAKDMRELKNVIEWYSYYKNTKSLSFPSPFFASFEGHHTRETSNASNKANEPNESNE